MTLRCGEKFPSGDYSEIVGNDCRVIYKDEELETGQCDDIILNISLDGVDQKPHPIQIQDHR